MATSLGRPPDGGPYGLAHGARLDQKTFHERYERTPHGFHAELIEGTVHVMSPLELDHGRHDVRFIGILFNYRVATPGTVAQATATAIMGDASEPQPDSASLIRDTHGGQTVDDVDGYMHGAPELIVEVAFSSLSTDMRAKFRDYERAGVREYVVYDGKTGQVHWSVAERGHIPAPAGPRRRADPISGLPRPLVRPGRF